MTGRTFDRNLGRGETLGRYAGGDRNMFQGSVGRGSGDDIGRALLGIGQGIGSSEANKVALKIELVLSSDLEYRLSTAENNNNAIIEAIEAYNV